MRIILSISLLVILLTCISCKQGTGSGKATTDSRAGGVVTDPSKLTIVIHPHFVVTGTDTFFSQADSSRLRFIGEKLSKADSVRKIKLRVPYPPDTAVVMPVVRILKPTGAEILITPYKVE